MITRVIEFKTLIERLIKLHRYLPFNPLTKRHRALVDLDLQALRGALQGAGTNLEPRCGLAKGMGSTLRHAPTGFSRSVKNGVQTHMLCGLSTTPVT